MRGRPGAAKALTNILIEGIGGKQRHLRCVPRCPQGLPLDTTGVRERRRKQASSGKNSNTDALLRVGDSSTSHLPSATAAAAAAAATAKAQTRPPAWSLSGTWATSALPAQNLPDTCPARTGPTKAPPLPDSPCDRSYRRAGVMPAFSAFALARSLRRTGSSRRAEADYRAQA